MDDRLMRLAAAVKARREQLGLAQDELQARGGPSDTTVVKIEKGRTEPSRPTLRKLDQSLGWAAGAARELLQTGKDPDLAKQPSGPPPEVTEMVSDLLTDADEDGERAREYRAKAVAGLSYLSHAADDETLQRIALVQRQLEDTSRYGKLNRYELLSEWMRLRASMTELEAEFSARSGIPIDEVSTRFEQLVRDVLMRDSLFTTATSEGRIPPTADDDPPVDPASSNPARQLKVPPTADDIGVKAAFQEIVKYLPDMFNDSDYQPSTNPVELPRWSELGVKERLEAVAGYLRFMAEELEYQDQHLQRADLCIEWSQTKPQGLWPEYVPELITNLAAAIDRYLQGAQKGVPRDELEDLDGKIHKAHRYLGAQYGAYSGYWSEPPPNVKAMRTDTALNRAKERPKDPAPSGPPTPTEANHALAARTRTESAPVPTDDDHSQGPPGDGA